MKKHLLFLNDISFNSFNASRKKINTFYITLTLIFICFVQLNAQTSKIISITASCSEHELDNYLETTFENGKISFVMSGLEVVCNDYTTEASCDFIPIDDYFIRWTGTQWEWGYTLLDCQWFVNRCIPAFRISAKSLAPVILAPVILATNTEDTALPPASGWTMASNGCLPILTVTDVESPTLHNKIINTFNSEVSFSPNPTTEGIRIDLGDNYDLITVDLINLYGQKIATKTSKNTSSVQLDINQSPGLYLLKVTDQNGKQATLKVVKK